MGKNLIQDLEKKILSDHDHMKKLLALVMIRKIQTESIEKYHFILNKLVKQSTNVPLISVLLGVYGGPTD